MQKDIRVDQFILIFILHHKIMKKLRKILFLNYAVNLRSREVHRIKTLHHNCHLEKIKCKVYVWPIIAHILCRYYGYNGCWWCFREKDTNGKK